MHRGRGTTRRNSETYEASGPVILAFCSSQVIMKQRWNSTARGTHANRYEDFCDEAGPANLGDQACAKTIAQARLAGRVRNYDRMYESTK